MFSMLMPAPHLTPELFVDTFCSTKRHLTNKIILDPVLNKAANEFITAQSDFAKMMIKNYINISKHSMDAATTLWFPKRAESHQTA